MVLRTVKNLTLFDIFTRVSCAERILPGELERGRAYNWALETACNCRQVSTEKGPAHSLKMPPA